MKNTKDIREKIDAVLRARGIDPTISDFNNKLKAKVEQEYKENIAKEIEKRVSESIESIVNQEIQNIETANEKFKDQIVEAVKGIKIDNQVSVGQPEIKMPEINIPEIKVPEVKVRMPDIKIPEIKVPKVEMPKEITVNGFGSFVKAMLEVLKNQFTVKIGGVDRKHPLPVILCDQEGKYYKALNNLISSGGGGSIKGLMNVAGAIINPATEDTLEGIAGFNIPKYDYQSLGYTSDNLTTMVFKTGGVSGTTVATLTLAYDGDDNITSITKS